MKVILTKGVLVLLVVLMLCSLFSCKKDDKNEGAEPVDFAAMSDEELSSFISLGEYKGLTVTLGSATKGEAVWAAVKKNAMLKAYPEEQVEYYISQQRAQYAYYAEQADMSYEEMLSEVGETEQSIKETAEQMTLGDLVYHALLRAEGIELSKEEKSKFFERYVEKFVADYGYTREYVKENMADEIYESMLYDKVTEFLITNNQFE